MGLLASELKLEKETELVKSSKFFCVKLLVVSTKYLIFVLIHNSSSRTWLCCKRNYKRTSLVFSSDAILCVPTHRKFQA